MPKKIEISHRTIIFTVLFLIGLWFLVQIKSILLTIFIAIIFMSALNPLVDRLNKYRIPRWLAIALLYIFVLGTFGGLLAIIITPLIDQTAIVINTLIQYFNEINIVGFDQNLITSQLSQIGLLPGNLLRVTVGFFSNLFSIVFLAIITFYLLLERNNLNHYLAILFGQDQEERAGKFIDHIEKRLGGWVRGEAILMTTIGVMTYIGLRVLGIEYALPLAILAGMLEVLPNIGPIVSGIPAVLIGFTISPIMGLAVLALYFLIQQLENSVIAPKIMEKAVGVRPLFTIISLAIGFQLAGVAGAVLAVPIVLVLQVVYNELVASGRFKNLTSEE